MVQKYHHKFISTISNNKTSSGLEYIQTVLVSPAYNRALNIHCLVAIQSVIPVLRYLASQNHMQNMIMLSANIYPVGSQYL